MAMTQLAATPAGDAAAASASSSTASASQSASSRGAKTEIQGVLGRFDALINQMMDYPAKDIINALTKLAERVQFAAEIVSFLETKIHRVAPNCKLPIFYLTDSILKNIRGPYPSLFATRIVPLYCNCVRQVSGKDLRRFVHVLNTWESTKLFPAEAVAHMRAAAQRAQADVAQRDPSAAQNEPVSFSQEKPPPRLRGVSSGLGSGSAAADRLAQQQQDMELRSLLTKLQNDMGIHPTEHMSLEEVRTNNPAYYRQLLDFQAQSKLEQTAAGSPSGSASGSAAGRAAPLVQRPSEARDPRRLSPTRAPAVRPPPRQQRQPPARQQRAVAAPETRTSPPAAAPARGRPARPAETRGGNAGRAGSASTAQSANVAHLMKLLKSKQRAGPSRPQRPVQPPAQPPQAAEITNEPPRAPDAAAVMSILQKLKGMPHGAGGPPPRGPPPPPPGRQQQRQQQQQQQQQPPGRSDHAARMWFSEQVVAHKDRVEANVQKLYAALPLVCRESGLRFREQKQLDAHLDFLFQYNRARKERGKGGVSRSWYPDEAHWVADFAGASAPRESTSSSFFDRKESDDAAGSDQAACDKARVPADDAVPSCRICGESFAKSWDEDEEDWVYTNAVAGTIHETGPAGDGQLDSIFHKYCYDTVLANSKYITPAHLIPDAQADADADAATAQSDEEARDGAVSGVKRPMEEEDESDSDGDDVKRVKTD